MRELMLALLVLISAAPIPATAADSGGPFGGAVKPPRDAMSVDERQRIEQLTIDGVARLRAEGRSPVRQSPPVRLAWPVAPWNGLTASGIDAISNYIDQNPDYPGWLLDYMCGNRTYDLSSGYNHRGTDIFSWPNPWLYMSQDKVAIVAGAPGTIVYVEDDWPDMSCGFNNLPWNAVYVQHADGSIAWYGHLKRGSATTKSVGDPVVTGEYLGIMGSSGSSTGPHLHLELWQDETYTQLIDPWDGPCNSLSEGSRWLGQQPYLHSMVNDLTVGPSPPAILPCPQLEVPHTGYDVTPGVATYFTMYLRDQQDGMVTDLAILRPNGTVWDEWQHVNQQYYSASYWWWWRALPESPQGNWTFRVRYADRTYERQFNIGPAPAGTISPQADRDEALSVAKVGDDQYRLGWGASCKSSDSDYAVYEGAIGEFADHGQVTCSTGGEFGWTVTSTEADRYWLVVPLNAQREGSAGSDSDGVPRVQAPPGERCVPRSFVSCGWNEPTEAP